MALLTPTETDSLPNFVVYHASEHITQFTVDESEVVLEMESE